jgi:HD-GYP domain-containing protein (c-di-GMP phosphodiesterase class II)
MLGQAMNLSEKSVETLRSAALLHDVGKIGIPQEILIKKERLTPEEFELIKQHPVIGINILKDVTLLEKEIPVILHHHERFDGKGYPHGLKSNEIPLGARILSVADAYDAMTTDRVYQKKMSQEEAFAELLRCSGKQFSPEVVDTFIAGMARA